MTTANLSGANYSHLLRLWSQWISRTTSTEYGTRNCNEFKLQKSPSSHVGRKGIKDTGSKVARNRLPWSFVEFPREKTVFEIPGSMIDNQQLIDANEGASCIADSR